MALRWSLAIGPLPSIGSPRAFTRLAQRIHDAAHQTVADGNRHNAPGAADFVALHDLLVFAEEHRANLVLFEVQRDAGHVVRELDELPGHHFFQSVNAGDAVAD